jgi:hypothetical protein
LGAAADAAIGAAEGSIRSLEPTETGAEFAETPGGVPSAGDAEVSAWDVDDAGVCATGVGEGGWATCGVATLSTSVAAGPVGLKATDAVWDDAPAAGVGEIWAGGGAALEAETKMGGAVAAASVAPVDVVAAVSCAWMAEDNPWSAAARRGFEDFADGAGSLAGDETAPVCVADVVLAYAALTSATTVGAMATAGSSAADGAVPGARRRCDAAAGGLSEAGFGEPAGGDAAAAGSA